MVDPVKFMEYIKEIQTAGKHIEKTWPSIDIEDGLTVTQVLFTGCDKPKWTTYLSALLNPFAQRRYDAKKLIEFYNRNRLCQFVLWKNDKPKYNVVVDGIVFDIMTNRQLIDEIYKPQISKLIRIYYKNKCDTLSGKQLHDLFMQIEDSISEYINKKENN